ncbi:hypothetical protein BV898_09938 [Hypsibius exemplaris]|uniref:Uncharacterized protein n=1 Tax=Hypsibius exemplaris TaxID=2072580 RepID=A0A1W0WKU4_HYPEX|nr:hypothetical protein BV898_09938 [Hypsibius exemplaris]
MDSSSRLLVVVLGILAAGLADATDRTLDAYLNPGCPTTSCTTFGVNPPYANNLVYIRSEVVNVTDAKQYRIFWSTIGAPTFIITEVSPTDPKDIQLAWNDFLEDHTPEGTYFTLYGGRYAGIEFAKLIEYDDVNNTGQITDANDTRLYYLDRNTVHWLNVTLIQEDDGNLLANLTALITQENVQFNLTIQVRAHPGDGRAAQNPRMLFTPSSVNAVHSEDISISDEYSPGIFTVERVGGTDTYVQWRPIVYTKVNPGVSDSTRSHTGPLLPINNTMDWTNHTGWGLPYSLLGGLNGILDNGTTLMRFNVSFGITDDDYYNSTGFQEWSCELGVGQPPIDVVSKNVKLIIAIGFGIPAVLIVIAATYVGYLRYKKRRENRLTLLTETTTTNYQTLTD